MGLFNDKTKKENELLKSGLHSQWLQCNELQKENDQLKQMLTPEMQNTLNMQQTITQLNSQIEMLQNRVTLLNNEILSYTFLLSQFCNSISYYYYISCL